MPFLLRVPGVTDSGMSTAALVELIDVYPTLADLAGLPMPETCPPNSKVRCAQRSLLQLFCLRPVSHTRRPAPQVKNSKLCCTRLQFTANVPVPLHFEREKMTHAKMDCRECKMITEHNNEMDTCKLPPNVIMYYRISTLTQVATFKCEIIHLSSNTTLFCTPL